MLLAALVLVGCQPSSSVTPTSVPIASSPVPPTPTVQPAPAWTDADQKTTEAFAKNLRDAYPNAAWPHWFADKMLAWTTLGLDGGGVESVIATDGTISPAANTVGLDFWLRDE